MNYADKMEQEARLMGRLASWMEQHGQILYDRQQSNAYAGVCIREIAWRGRTYRIIDVDGIHRRCTPAKDLYYGLPDEEAHKKQRHHPSVLRGRRP
jgi:hypothetical protein